MGVLLKKMVKEHETNSSQFWNNILEGDKILSDEEAKELQSHIKSLRKNHGFRE